MMEPLVWLLATTTTLTSYLTYLRQIMATLHVGMLRAFQFCAVGYWRLEIVGVGGARLILDFSFRDLCSIK